MLKQLNLLAAPPPFRVLSYGGGLDSFAVLLLLIFVLREPPDLVVFADVADPEHLDSGEWPGTYQHIRDVVIPLCKAHGIRFVWLGTDLIPIRPSKDRPQGYRSLIAYFLDKQMMFGRESRLCSVVAKVERITRYVQQVRPPGAPVVLYIGFEAGEQDRVTKDPHGKGYREWHARFPLIEANLCRCRAEALVRKLGYPVPRKSACMHCAFNSLHTWKLVQRTQPAAFAQAQQVEDQSKLTSNGVKLRFGYRSEDNNPRLSDYVRRQDRPRQVRCEVCGGWRASKRVGCGYLDEPEELPLPTAA